MKPIAGSMNFDIDKLGCLLEQQCPEVCFSLLHGSAKDGTVKEGSDVDIALFLNGKPTLDLYEKVSQCLRTLAPNAKADVGILNGTEPVYRFEALKGHLLFCRDQEKYLRFFSLTCREYESQMASYERQRKYRQEYEVV